LVKTHSKKQTDNGSAIVGAQSCDKKKAESPQSHTHTQQWVYVNNLLAIAVLFRFWVLVCVCVCAGSVFVAAALSFFLCALIHADKCFASWQKQQ